MENINDILARAAALRDETALNSIDPARAGGIMYDTLIALNDLWLQQGAALVISKIYASVAAMEADTAPVSDLTGQPIHAGQIVVIASSDADNGSVYRFNGVDGGVSSWSLVGKIGDLENYYTKEQLDALIDCLCKVRQGGFHVIDADLNIGMRYDGNGLDFAKISEHAVTLLRAAGLGGDVSFAGYTDEPGLFVVDDGLRIGVKVDNTGLHAINVLEYREV